MHMNTKKGVICPLVVTVLSLCMVNVTTALPRNQIAAPHSKNVTDVKTTIPTTLTFTCPTLVNVNEPFGISGSLTAGGTGVCGAHINGQVMTQGQWTTFSGYTTDSNGNISGTISTNYTGLRFYRLSYDGDAQYAPSASNGVVVYALV